jgi:hypothetical protein
MPIRWSAASWRPTIKLVNATPGQQQERPDVLRIVRPITGCEGHDVEDASAWI